MSESQRVYAVDRIEGASAILVEDGGAAEVRVGRDVLPSSVREGSVLRVPLAADGSPRWEAAVQDEALEQARRQEAAEALDELRKRDPGGDVAL